MKNNYSQLPKDLCVKGKEARRYSSERLSEFTARIVEPPADTFGGRDEQ